MTPLILWALLISGINLIEAQNTYRYIQDRTGESDKDRLRELAFELFKEARYKIKQLDGLKDEASMFTSFAVGTTIGRIREKYRSMLELYRMTKNKFTGVSKLVLPHIEPWRPVHYFIRLELIRALEVDIDQLVHILQSLSDDAPKFDIKYLVGNAKPRPKTSTTPEDKTSEERK